MQFIGHAVDARQNGRKHRGVIAFDVKAQRIRQKRAERKIFGEMPQGRNVYGMPRKRGNVLGQPCFHGGYDARIFVKVNAACGAHGKDDCRHSHYGRP